MADSKFANPDQNNRFYSRSGEEIRDILEGRNALNTRRATKSNIKIFHQTLQEKGLPKLEQMAVQDLPKILEEFYPNLRRANGDDYKIQSMKCICAGINRWTKSNWNIDIIGDVTYTKANEIFKGVAKIAREQGRGATKPYPVIAAEDMERIATYFLHDMINQPDPRKVVRCVIFYVIYFFCCRGRENLYNMKLDTFAIGCDPDGRQFLYQAIDELDKNHRSDDQDEANQGRIYERPGTKIDVIHYKHNIQLDLTPENLRL